VTPPRNSFFIPFLVWLFLGLIIAVICSEKDILLWVNQRNTLFFDYFFEIYTNTGNGFFAIFVGVMLILFISIRAGLAVVVSYATEGIIVQVFKQFLFTDRPRPWARYGKELHLHLVNSFTPYTNNSFPSGHTATAFCLATIIVLIWPKMKPGWLLFILAALVGYSRVYLSQHYFIDIYVGSVIGVLSAIPIYCYFYSPNKKSKQQNLRLDRPLLKLNR
jgi:membrane-associated phospholipid phosphatase